MTKSVKYIGTTSRWPELAVTGKQSTWEPGKIEERSDTEAAQLLGTGLFADQSALQLPDSKVKAISAVVSTPGNQPSATLAATVGTPGQIVRLADGPDAGAILVWSTPEGSNTETWCWWLWPQAAY